MTPAIQFWLRISNTNAPVELKLAALAQAYGVKPCQL